MWESDGLVYGKCGFILAKEGRFLAANEIMKKYN
jgi:hypothetical protein